MNIKIKFASLSGFVFGPMSQTFKQIKKTYAEIEDDMDTWKYISLFTNQNITYDFRIRMRSSVIDFIVAVSNATMTLN